MKPDAIVALGATAARGVLRRTLTIAVARTGSHALEDGTVVFVTIHPSLLLRIKDEADRDAQYRAFVSDLRRAKQHIG